VPPFNAIGSPTSRSDGSTSRVERLKSRNTPQSTGRPIPNVSESTTQSTAQSNELCETWNLTVEDHPEFFANGILVHNCSMSLFVLKSRVREAVKVQPLKPIDPIEHARNGHLTLPGGISTLSTVPLDMLTAEDLEHILSRKHLPPGPSSKV